MGDLHGRHGRDGKSISRDLRRGLSHIGGGVQHKRLCLEQHGKQQCSNTDTICNHMFFETTPF